MGMTWREGGNHTHQKIDFLMIGQICRIEYILLRTVHLTSIYLEFLNIENFVSEPTEIL